MSLASIKNEWRHVKNFKSIFEQKSIWIVWYQTEVSNTNTEKAEVERFYEALKDLLELTTKKISFSTWGVEFKSGKWRDNCSNRQVWPGVQNEAGHRLTEFCQENAVILANTLCQQHKRWLYTWTSPDGQYQNQIDYIICSQRWKSSIQSAKTRPESVAQTWTLYCKIQTLIEESSENHQTIQAWPKSNPSWLYSGSEK